MRAGGGRRTSLVPPAAVRAGTGRRSPAADGKLGVASGKGRSASSVSSRTAVVCRSSRIVIPPVGVCEGTVRRAEGAHRARSVRSCTLRFARMNGQAGACVAHLPASRRWRASTPIEGHTDHVGSDEMNQALSEQRAAAVGSYLAAAGGMESITFISRGYGEKRPVASNETSEGRQLNRRVEITVIPQ